MPLLPGKGNVGRNIAAEIEAGKPKKQANAIALSVARKSGTIAPKRKYRMTDGGKMKV